MATVRFVGARRLHALNSAISGTAVAARSVVRNEIFHHREEIVARIRKLPGCEAIKSLNIRAG